MVRDAETHQFVAKGMLLAPQGRQADRIGHWLTCLMRKLGSQACLVKTQPMETA